MACFVQERCVYGVSLVFFSADADGWGWLWYLLAFSLGTQVESVAHLRWAAGELLDGSAIVFWYQGEIQCWLPLSWLEWAGRIPQLMEMSRDGGPVDLCGLPHVEEQRQTHTNQLTLAHHNGSGVPSWTSTLQVHAGNRSFNDVNFCCVPWSQRTFISGKSQS